MVDLVAWAACGAMALTGDAEGPPLAIDSPAASVAEAQARRFGLDAGVLGERAALLGLRRRGRSSCGGATRLLRGCDGWLALSLARPDDLALLPALVGVDAADPIEAWPRLQAAVAARPVAEIEAQAALLGLPAGAVASSAGTVAVSGAPRPGTSRRAGPWEGGRALVVDLSTLWAGPLCSDLLRRAGARVVKVEDLNRPDGTRSGPPAFFDLLNGGKRSVALDLRSSAGGDHLRALLATADVVVTSARARAFDQLGITPKAVLGTSTDKVWVAITAYGWDSPRVGFGDDAAAAAGVVAWHPADGEPRFAADAPADPLCGLLAATLAMDALDRGGRWFLDVSLAGAAARIAPPRVPARAAAREGEEWRIDGLLVEGPTPRAPVGAGPRLGGDNDRVLRAVMR